MKTNEKKLMAIVNAVTQEVWNKNVDKLPDDALPTLRLNMIVRKRVGTPEEESTYDELIKFIDSKCWVTE